MIALSLIPETVTDWTGFLVLGSLATMLVSLAKAGFGGSIGLLSVPIMIYACGGQTQLALGIMLPLLIACDQVSLISWWGRWNLRTVKLLVPGAILGVVAGAAALWGFQRAGAGEESSANAMLQLGIGVIALGFVALQAVRALRSRPLEFRPVFWQGTLVGTAAGFTSTLAHAAGPVVSMYMLPQGMAKGQYVASTVLYYWFGNLIKLPVYVALALIDYESIGASVSLLPAVVGGALLGLLLHRRIGQRSFTGVVYVLLALAGADLIRKGATALWG